MADITKKFEDFKKKQDKKFDKTQEFEPLSNDIVAMNKLDTGDYEVIDEPVDILQVTGIITDPDEISKIEENFTMDTSVNIKDVKRGQILWLTAMLQRTSGTSINSQKLGVVKVRVVDYFYGLSKLNQINPNK
jgi:hypothetical protein